MSLSDVLDDAADAAVAGRSLDAATILARAERPEYSPVLRPVVGLGAPRWRPRRGLPRHPVARGVLIAASVVALAALVLAAVPGVQRALPQPAQTPKAPGQVPRLVHLPPPWTPTVTERPISRAVYVGVAAPGTGSEQDAGVSVATPPAGPWIVGADHGELRLLPGVPLPDGRAGTGAEAVLPTLSPDGTRVAWVTEGRFASNSVVHVVDVPTGELRSLGLDGSFRRGLSVESLAFSPDGRFLAASGQDRPGADRSGTQTLIVLDTATLQVVTACRFGSSAPDVAWDGDGLRATDCGDPEPALVTGAGGGPAVVDGLPAVPGSAERSFSMGSPVATPPTVTGPDGARWFTRRATDTGETSPWQLFSAGGSPTGADRAPRRVTDLGSQAGAVALAAGGTGVVVSRWQRDTSYPSGQFGASDVVLVRPGGEVEVLSRGDGVQPRVAAVASAVVEGATAGRTRISDADPAGPRVLDVAWWSWTASAVLDRIPLPGARFWVFAGILGVWLLVRRYVTRLPVRDRPLLAGAAVAALLAVLVGPALVAAVGLPDAPVRSAPPGRTGPVVPAVLRDVRLVPPRAYDAPGSPRTTAVAIVYVGELAGRQGVYGTDAATGAWVRLDDLPSGRDLTDGVGDANAAVSPNGRYVVLGTLRYDLATARAEQVVPDGVEVNLMPGEVSRSTAVLDDGTVALVSADGKGRLYVYPPTGGMGFRGLVPDVPGVAYVAATDDGRFRVDLQLPDGAGDEPQDLVGVLDMSGARPRLDTVRGVQQGDVAALSGGWAAQVEDDGLRLSLRRDPGALGPGPRPGEGLLAQPGGTDAVWLTASPTSAGTAVRTVVTLGAGRTADLAVVRTALPQGSDAAAVPAELTRVDLPSVPLGGQPGTVLTLAAGQVAYAVPVAVPVDPWWARALRPG